MSTALASIGTDQLIALSHGHPLVRHLAPHRVPGDTAWSYGAAVGLVYHYWEGGDAGGDLVVVGPANDAARLTELVSSQVRRPLALPAAAYPLVAEGVLGPPHEWGFRWTDRASTIATDGVAWLAADSDEEVRRLLDEVFPDASFKPGSSRIRGWAGLRDDEGRLIACAADTTEAAGMGFVASITARTDCADEGSAAG